MGIEGVDIGDLCGHLGLEKTANLLIQIGDVDCMCRPASCERRKTAVRSTAINSFQNSMGYSAAGALRIAPALFTKMSIEPNSAIVFSMSPAHTFGSPTSPEK